MTYFATQGNGVPTFTKGYDGYIYEAKKKSSDKPMDLLLIKEDLIEEDFCIVPRMFYT